MVCIVDGTFLSTYDQGGVHDRGYNGGVEIAFRPLGVNPRRATNHQRRVTRSVYKYSLHIFI